MPPVIKAEDQPVLAATSTYPFAKWKFEKFNPVQSRCMEYYDKDNNGLIAAMTSAGKTVVAEMFLAHEIRKRGGKGMFLAPLRALAREKVNEWTDKGYHFGDLKTSICTGDYRLTKERAKELAAANLIIMTSEMLNHRSRNHKSEKNTWLKEVGTLVIDECVPPDALIDTDQGIIPIGQIVDNNLDVRVASFNHDTQTVEYKKIVARQKKLLKRKWITLYYQGGYICVTENHTVWCEGRGYIPSKMVIKGDIVYVRDNEQRAAGDSRDTSGRRLDFDSSAWQISTASCAAVGIANGFGRVEVCRVEKTGCHPSEGGTEQGIRQATVQIQHSLAQGSVGYRASSASFGQEAGYRAVAGGDNRSSCTGGLVHGRWQSNPKSDDNSYRGILTGRSSSSGELDEGILAVRLLPLSDEDLLATPVHGIGAGHISEDRVRRNDSVAVLQTRDADGDDFLFDVRSGIQSRPSQYPYNPQSIAVRTGRMSAEVGSDSQSDENMVGEESWCCDLEVEDNNNFFVNGVLVHNSHLLTVPGRGDHLEVGLMKFTDINPKARLVLLSATMPNVEEIADWVSYSLTKRDTFMLRSKYRPVPLTTHYEAYSDEARRYDAIEEEKINKAMDIIEWYPDDKFLVFAHTKRTGEMMKQALRAAGIEAQFHNADLEAAERAKVEDRFRNDPKLRVIVATSTLAWGLNLPARRVLILGVNRGLGEVEPHDILQMVGRSGRLGIDPMGDAYILVPESREQEYRTKLSKPGRIESQLLEKSGENHKVLAFHLVSEIHHGDVETTEDVHRWYKRSLAYFQNKALEETVVDKTLELLRKCGAVWEENGKWSCRPIGKVSSMFYFSPFDVSDLYFNFKDLFDSKKEDDDYYLAMALANIDSQRTNIVSRIEKDEMSVFSTKVRAMMPGKFMNDACLKAGFCYFNLLNGISGQATAAIQRNLQYDFNRLSQVLQALDSFTGNWQMDGYFRTLEGRIVNGVPTHLVDLCRLPNIGRVRATKLYDAGYKSIEAIADMDLEKFKKITNMKQDASEQIMKDAQRIALTA